MKQGLHINKTNFSLLLREVHDKVLTLRNNVKAFETVATICSTLKLGTQTGMFHHLMIPTQNLNPEDDEREWEDVPITTNITVAPLTISFSGSML